MSDQTRADPQTGIAAGASLLIWADALDDLEKSRIATENRIRSIEQVKQGSENDVARLSLLLQGVKSLEHVAELGIRASLREHPLGEWIKATPGVGMKQGGRLLASLGDLSRFPTVSKLWAYCGYHVVPAQTTHDAQPAIGGDDPSAGPHLLGDAHPTSGSGTLSASGQAQHDAHVLLARGTNVPGDQDHREDQPLPVAGSNVRDPHELLDAQVARGVAPKRARGQRANWSAEAKMRAYLIAEKCVMQNGAPDKHGKQRPRSPYRDVYDAGRIKYAEATHSTACVRCGPKGKPAPAGSPLSDGHKHARAMRLMSKAILKDLWLEWRRVAKLVVTSRDHVRPPTQAKA